MGPSVDQLETPFKNGNMRFLVETLAPRSYDLSFTLPPAGG